MIWNYPTRILFGAGMANQLAQEVQSFGGQRVLLVTDRGVRSAGLVEPIEKQLRAAGLPCQVHDGTSANPTEADVEQGAAYYQQQQADCIVALGGGAALDAAKLIAVRTTVSNPFEELDDDRGGDQHIPAQLPPVAAVPTTAGTGSEVGRAAVVTVARTNRKTVIFSPSMLPKVAILDPELSRSMPASVTAATGFDALTHCLEAYVAQGDHPMADAIALGGIELVKRSLLKAVEHPEDLDARGDMLKAAMMGATAFQKGLGACHSMAHPLSSECNLHHGLANAICLTAVVEFNLPAASERYRAISRIFGGHEADELAGLLSDFRNQLGLGSSLAAEGVTANQLETLADKALADGCHRHNPRPCRRDDLLKLYQAVF